MAALRNIRIALSIQLRSRTGLLSTRWLQTEAGEGTEAEKKALTPEEYNEQFEEYKQKMHAFRVAAQEEFKRKRETEGEAVVEKKRSSTERGPQRTPQLTPEEKQQREQARAKGRELHQQKFELAKQRREVGFKRESIRRKLLAKEEEVRYKALLESSRTWITEETLDDRIKQAIDRVTNLY